VNGKVFGNGRPNVAEIYELDPRKVAVDVRQDAGPINSHYLVPHEMSFFDCIVSHQREAISTGLDKCIPTPDNPCGIRLHMPQIDAKIVIVLEPFSGFVSDAKKDMPVGTEFLPVSGYDGLHTNDKALTVGESRRVEVNAPVGRVVVVFFKPGDRNVAEVRFLSEYVERKRQYARNAKRESTE